MAFVQYELSSLNARNRAVGHLAHHVLLSQWFAQSGGGTIDTKLWPPNSTDFNPVDYKITGSDAVTHLSEASEEQWWAEEASDWSMVSNPTQRHWSSNWSVACQSQMQTFWTFVVVCLSITVNVSWRLMLALLWLSTDWHTLCFTT